MTELRDAEAAAAAPAADADDDGPVDVPEGVGEPMDPADGDGTMAAPLEGEVLDAPADAATPAPAEADPEDLRRNTPQRRATLQELTRLFRGGEAMAAILTGRSAPSGRLPVTFPASVQQLPIPVLTGYVPARQRPLGRPS